MPQETPDQLNSESHESLAGSVKRLADVACIAQNVGCSAQQAVPGWLRPLPSGGS